MRREKRNGNRVSELCTERDRETDRIILWGIKSILSGQRGSGTEPDGADNPAFLAKSAPEQKKTAAAGTDGGYGDAGAGTTGGL